MLARDLEREYPKTNRDRGAAVRTMFEMRTQASDVNWKFGVIFTILALAVLLVACTNAAGLLLSRARTRTREIAVRLAIGAGRFRLIRLLLTESLVLALAGGLGGIAVGYVGIHFMGKFRIPAELPVKIPFRMDTRVLLASFAFSVLSALICGLAPALQSTRLNLVKGLKSADVDDAGRKRLWGRNALVVAQIAMSLMLLAASFLMFRGFQHSLNEGLGFAEQARDHVLMVRSIHASCSTTRPGRSASTSCSAERVRQAPGVRSAAFTQNPPLSLCRLRTHCLRAGGVLDAARPREFPVVDGHRRRRVSSRRWGYRSCAAAASGRPTPPPRRASRSSTSSSRNTTGRAAIRWASASVSKARTARRSRSSASRRRSSTATAPPGRSISSTCRLRSTPSRAGSCWSGRTAIRRSSFRP